MLAFVLAAILAAIVVGPAVLLGARFRAGELIEAVCWLTLGVVWIAELGAVL
jgi:hypothetical protein